MAIVATSKQPRKASGRPTKTTPGPQKAHGREGTDHVVALGASAGGLKAMGRLLAGLRADFPAPIVAVVHLDPDHLSHLATLLQRETRLRVRVAKGGQVLAPGAVYVAPPDRHLEVKDGRVTLTRGARVHFSRPSVDRLFSSVADAYGDRAVAVVLSGTGGDGSVGVETVKNEGGFVVAQDPKTAEFGAMPANAVATGCVDAVLSIDAMPEALVRAVTHTPADGRPAEWPRVLALLQDRLGTNFTGYRESTLRRRLQRRVIATQQPDLKSYLNHLRKDNDELQRLHSEFLIKVSGFFRDPKEWTQLSSKVVRPAIRADRGKREFRVWSAGCATGEEAYSLAILFLEAIEASGKSRKVKVFATDIDEEALAVARRGVYADRQVEGLSRARLRRHFTQSEGGWRVSKDLRKMVIFGRHDLLRDPPLASIDVLACRNVLIYFRPDQTKLVLERLAYALKPGGQLFLGRSEGVHKARTGLKRVSGTARIFRRPPAEDVPRRIAPVSPKREPDRPEPSTPEPEGIADPVTGALSTLIRQADHVVLFRVDAENTIVEWNAAAAGFFGTRRSDAMGMPVAEIVGDSFWKALGRSVRERDGGNASTGQVRLAYGPSGGERSWLDVGWLRLEGDDADNQGMVFLGVEAPDGHPDDGDEDEVPVEAPVRKKLAATEALRSANQELETLNEELQSTSEEQQTLNEELESRNEELATVNEELQSLNEELNTLNEEVGVRIADAETLSGFLRTILDLAPQAVVGCDNQSRITFWNAMARQRFHLSPEQAIGKDLFDLVPVLDAPKVRKLVRGKGGRGSIQVDRGPGHDGFWRVQMAPVRDAGGRRHGYVLRVSDGDEAVGTKK